MKRGLTKKQKAKWNKVMKLVTEKTMQGLKKAQAYTTLTGEKYKSKSEWDKVCNGKNETRN